MREHDAKRRTGGVVPARVKSTGQDHESDGDNYENLPREGDHATVMSNRSATLSRAPLSVGVLRSYAKNRRLRTTTDP